MTISFYTGTVELINISYLIVYSDLQMFGKQIVVLYSYITVVY